MLSFNQFLNIQQGFMPRGATGFQRVVGRSPNDYFNHALQGVGGDRVREVHTDTQTGQTWDFQWSYAAPLVNPHFKW